VLPNTHSLDEVSRYLFLSSVIELCGASICVPGEMLNIERVDPLFQKIGDDGHAE